ncbi:MAG: hypothetical protein A2Z24_00030 [Candidatus Woykebacteria bacterium RBG_16_44_10]|uniref:Type II secretion system protein GspG C-terminal domain-containing protein n=1 Tax=Candidatus Woykebacteria bacterium RBG_16_44_10 TaxID=1802597 RepID=A0A1G1WCG4_9BACT|nr:MAG: hypothetical protein A2Z24_00030 [Candidatus Woykebacteria bacterium RBG_16_44_10]
MANFTPEKNVVPAKSPPSKVSNPFDPRSIEKSTYLHVVGIIVIAVLIAAASYAYLLFEQGRMIGGNKEVENGQSADSDKKFDQIQLKAKQDQQRRNDVDILNSALKSFFLKQKRAPDLLKELVPDPLKKLPTDPVTQKEYNYKPSQDKQGWQLSATLSDGSKFEVKGP